MNEFSHDDHAECKSNSQVVDSPVQTFLARGGETETLRQIQENEAKLRFVIESSTNVFYSHTAEHQLTYLSPQIKGILGYEVEEALKCWTELATDHPLNIQGFEQTRKAIETGEAQPTYELQLRHKDGHPVWVEVREAPVVEGDKTVAIVGSLTDVSERKRLEEGLERRIVALTRPLEDGLVDITLDELFDLNQLQIIQDSFAKATGVASIIVDPQAEPITRPSNFTRYCGSICRQTEKGCRNCKTFDRELCRMIGSDIAITCCPYPGIWNAGVRIEVGGVHVANWMIGQVRNQAHTEADVSAYAREIGKDETELIAAFREMPLMSRADFQKVVDCLNTLAQQLSATAYQNVQQARFIAERREAEAALLRQQALLEAIAKASTLLLAELDLERALAGVVKIIGEVSGQDRAYIFEASPDEQTGEPIMIQRHEWVREGIRSESDNADNLALPLVKLVPDWVDQLLGGHAVQGLVQDLPQEARAIPLSQGIVALMLIPIMIRGQFWGFFGFDNCREAYVWDASEVSLMKTLAADIGGALIRYESGLELQRLSTVIKQSPDAVIMTDIDGAILYVNPAFEKMTGYGREEVLGQNPRLLKSGEHDEAFYAELWNMIKGGKTWSGRLINKRKDGSLFTARTSITPVLAQDGGILHFVAIKRDISKELEQEEQRRQSQKMEAVGQLAGGVAHDFNNMLMAIMGYVEMCFDDLESDHPVREYLDQINHTVERSADLTRQLLAFARKQPIAPQQLDLNDAVVGMLKMLKRLIGEDIELSWRPGAGLWPIVMDPSQLDQILANLCVNARDAIQGGGQIAIKTQNLDLRDAGEVADVPTGEYVLLTVADTGGGIAPDVIAHVFEPFFTTKEFGKGTGLGLATIHGIVRQNNGHIEVESALGQGTTFRIYLPRFREETSMAGGLDVEEKVAGGSETVLLVEDERSVRLITERMLRGMGYQVITAATPQQALELGRRNRDRIDLLLSDVVMPGMNGRELYEALVQDMPGLQCLFISGYTADIIADRGVLDKHYDYLSKPFRSDQLATKLREQFDPQRKKISLSWNNEHHNLAFKYCRPRRNRQIYRRGTAT